MPFATRELRTTSTRQPTPAARLMDMPGFDCTTLGVLVLAAADEIAADALAEQACALVAAARQTGAQA